MSAAIVQTLHDVSAARYVLLPLALIGLAYVIRECVRFGFAPDDSERGDDHPSRPEQPCQVIDMETARARRAMKGSAAS